MSVTRRGAAPPLLPPGCRRWRSRQAPRSPAGVDRSLAKDQRLTGVSSFIEYQPDSPSDVAEADLDAELIARRQQGDKLLVVRKSPLADLQAGDALVVHVLELRPDLHRIRGCGNVHPHPRLIGGRRLGKSARGQRRDRVELDPLGSGVAAT